MASENRTWYESTFREGMRRPSGIHEIVESNPLDWQRLRVLKDGKLVPFMEKEHIGAPTELELDLLREQAENGNVFLYRMGEVYPQRLIGGAWYSTDPAVREGRPELNLPEEPTAPPPFERRLGEKLREAGLPENATEATLQSQQDKERYNQLRTDLLVHEKEVQDAYQAQMKTYTENRDRLQREYNAKLQTWQNRTTGYESLNFEVKNAIRDGVSARQTEIFRNRETQRAHDFDRTVLMDWYNGTFRTNIMRPSKDEKLAATDGMDWDRVRIWDGTQFTRLVPEGHVGAPGNEALLKLRDAVQSGNLFMYQTADKIPSKWMGNHWRSMDRDWIEKVKPEPVKELVKPQPIVQAPPVRPELENFTQGISQKKMAKGDRRETDRYNQAVREYQTALNRYNQEAQNYDRAVANYQQELEAYETEMEARRNAYDQQMKSYESMVKSYEALSPELREAMERDALQRAEEIKRNKELEQRRANELVEDAINNQVQIENAGNRIDMLGAQPQEARFVGGPAALGQEAYRTIAPHGYNLPENSRLMLKDAAAIHLALAGSTQAAVKSGMSPAGAEQYAQMLEGMLRGNPSAEEMRYITASYDAANEYIGAYAGGNPKPLAEAMGSGLRNLINASRNRLELGPETVGMGMVAERIFSVLDKDEALLKNCTLSAEEMNYARGLAQLGAAYSRSLQSQISLTEVATGAKRPSNEELVAKSVDLLIAKTLDNYLKNGSEEDKQRLVSNLGAVKGNALDVIADVYKNDPAVREAATKYENLMNPDMNERMKQVAQSVVAGNMNNPNAPRVRGAVRDRIVRELAERERVARLTEEELKRENELKVVRGLLAQENPEFANIDLENELVTGKLQELNLVASYLSTKGVIADNGELLAMNDPRVLEEAADFARVRQMMEADNRANGREGERIVFNAIAARLETMRAVHQELNGEGNLELLSEDVFNRAKQLQEEREAAARLAVEDRANAKFVVDRENDCNIDWKARDVATRMEQLKAAREELGEDFRNLPLKDPRVLKKDYERRNVDPLREGIVNEAELNAEQLQDYKDRMQTIEYLKARGEGNLRSNKSRYDERVNNALEELRAARELYQNTIENPQPNLSLNDPRIFSMLVCSRASNGRSFAHVIKNEQHLARVTEAIQGKNLQDSVQAAKSHLVTLDVTFSFDQPQGQLQNNLNIPQFQVQPPQPQPQPQMQPVPVG